MEVKDVHKMTMRDQKRVLIGIIKETQNPKLINYLYGLITTFIEIRK